MYRSPGGFQVTVKSGSRTLRADYWGGAYIELTFAGGAYNPTEVINVWDYETDTSVIPSAETYKNPGDVGHEGYKRACDQTREGVRRAVADWIEAQDKEWPEWYEGYLENARH